MSFWEIQDEGKGIERNQLNQISAGMASSVGLQGMRERILQFSGDLQLLSDDTHLARLNRSFEGTDTKREKRQDWMAERAGFELAVLFATDSAFFAREIGIS
jgi:signal transduction histidine kinase